MGNGYFRTSQTSTTSSQRQRDKRGKDTYSYQHNYVDRVRLEDTNGNHYQQQQQHNHLHHQKIHDPRCPQLRAAGWRHTHKSVSHLDLATSCHSAAGAGLDRHRPTHHQTQQHLHRHQHQHQHQQQQQHQQQHQQSEQQYQSQHQAAAKPLQAPLTPHAQPHWTQCRVGLIGGQLRNARSLDYTQLEREENALDIAEFYWHFDAEAPLDQADNYAVNDNFETTAQSSPTGGNTATEVAAAAPTVAATATTATANSATVTATFLDFGSESCSLRRSRSLAVIREETFSDLQIGSANSSRRRSQLIPRARLVNRGFFRESPRLNNKQHSSQCEQQTAELADDSQSQISSATTCDSHQQQQQQLLLQQQHKQQQHIHHHCSQRQQLKQQQQQQQRHHRDSRDFDVYYDNLKRLDALALGLTEQLHPWHNDKSDLESLNSDYFKNSLHQSHSEQQQQQQQQHQQLQPSSLEFDALEQAVTLLNERPRIYQSRRKQQQSQHSQQQRSHYHCLQRHIDLGGDSCPEHSQSSVFPETTTSNSDDQTDSPSLSEQEYDLTHIEQIYQHADESGDAEESYELISLTTTTRTRFESSEEEEHAEEQQEEEEEEGDLTGAEESLITPTGTTAASDSDGTLKRGHSEQLDKLIAYDSVYLSSEDSSECTLIGESCESFEQRTFTSCLENGELETRSLLHISIEDTVYEPQPKQHKKEEEKSRGDKDKLDSQIFTQVLKVEHTTPPSLGVTSSVASKPRILSVVEKRKLKQEEHKQPPQPPELKRQATDTFVITSKHKSNLTENQYHSLPDVNIGVSLKVCENIDKELRTSYNLKRQQQRKETNRRQKGEECSHQVTRAETYDSIRRFGRAHQKARQKENEERERQQQQQREREVSTQEVLRRTKPEIEIEIEDKLLVNKQTLTAAQIEVETKEEQQKQQQQQQQQLTEEEDPLPTPPPPIVDEEVDFNEQPYNDIDSHSAVSILQPEQPKEAPVIQVANFSKLIERRAQEIRQRAVQTEEERREQSQLSGSFCIIVTDAHNNIIQTEAIKQEESQSTRTTIFHSSSLAGAPPSTSNPQQHSNSQRSLKRSSSAAGGKPAERRVLTAGTAIYKARPIRVLSSASSSSHSDSFGRHKMSRPQILHVVDSSKSAAGLTVAGSQRRRSHPRSLASNVSEVPAEYLQKVDAVKCYWNKLAAGNVTGQKEAEATTKEHNSRLHFQLGGSSSNGNGNKVEQAATTTDYCSIMPPSIEIVELGDGTAKTTIVSAAVQPQKQPQQQQQQDQHTDDEDDEDAAQFDHIRYKVLKSQQLIRSNILTARNKKEAQFDGLIQYLQDYSFQELLSNNNVVIVEPVRTKIERPLTVGLGITAASTKSAAKQANTQQTATNPKKPRQRHSAGAAAKRHFFYQPVRVNRELYEDELPDPDTVRNVRRFFEQNVLPTPGQGILVRSQQKFGGSACQLSPKARRARGYRYLTIDTSYGGEAAVAATAEEQPKGMELLEEHKIKHWDNASLSSGISSGDLSSPCGECQQHNQQQQQQQPEIMHKEVELSPVLACKDVHVLDVVRRHNSNAANAKARAKLASRRTWCVGGTAASEAASRYRQIYEHNLGQTHDFEEQHEAEEGEQEEAEAEQQRNNHDNEYDDDTEEPDMCDESYYVSNDVLAKIRECGSTVTYYGGRVLPSDGAGLLTDTMPSKQQQQQQQQQQQLMMNGLQVRQLEACQACQQQPSQRCEHATAQSQDSYQGIKFKLVKSNSCSSRLELAGADEADILKTDTEVVRKMVHHFECNQPQGNDVNLTINSQSTLAQQQQQQQQLEATARKQVTVNNHINVLPQESVNLNGQVEPDKADKQQQLELQPEGIKPNVTYHSQAMNIRLDLGLGRASADKTNTNNNKVCRNKNVDLAYKLVKQQQQQQQLIVSPGTQSEKLDERQTLTKLIKQPEVMIVPVEIHQSQQQQQQQPQERRLSNASSSASIVDRAVVRHYVANDKSIYERRKYDEIEFEEFEVYDPAKELERQQQQQQQQQQELEQEQAQAQKHSQLLTGNTLERRQTDAELYDSLDDRM